MGTNPDALPTNPESAFVSFRILAEMERKEFILWTGHMFAMGVMVMGYTVNYGPVVKIRRNKLRISPWMPLAVLGCGLSVFLAWRIWPEETERLRQALFPWTQEPAQEAFVGFQEEIKAGEPFTDAITAFCLEILDETNLAQ